MTALLSLLTFVLGFTVAVRPLRKRLHRYLCEVLLSLRFMLWELPLRAITGRLGRYDPARVRAMEIECGIRGPLSARERMDQALLTAGKITINQYRARRGLPPVPGPVTVDEWRHRRHPLAPEAEQALAAVYVQLSRAAVPPWAARWTGPADEVTGDRS